MTLTPEQIADGWIAHDGGPCPVEGSTLIHAIGHDPMRDHFTGRASENNWQRTHTYKMEPKP